MQNAPIESSTALTGTTFVTISVFMSRGHFPAPLRAKTNDKKRDQKLETLTFLNFWSRSEGLLFFAEIFFELIPGVL